MDKLTTRAFSYVSDQFSKIPHFAPHRLKDYQLFAENEVISLADGE
ncbi:hypothetical protein HMPREF1861_01301 [Corynebacterium kroppenstedtii]|nr:hypothetical protein HMPREF1861_01301 [Corynebacterium kroppenstedtii]